MASRNQSQWNMGSHNGNKVIALNKRVTRYDTGSLVIDGSWNLNPLRKSGNLLLMENFCGLILLDIKQNWHGANLMLTERSPELTRQKMASLQLN